MEPIVFIQNVNFGTYLSFSAEGTLEAGTLMQEKFRIGFEERSESSKGHINVWIYGLSSNKYLSFENGAIKASTEEATVSLEKVLAPEGSLNTVARLSQHSLYLMAFENAYISMGKDKTVSMVPDVSEREIFEVIVLDGSNPTEAIVAIRSRLYGNYLRASSDDVFRAESWISDKEKFVLIFQEHRRHKGIIQMASIQSLASGKYLRIQDGSLRLSSKKTLVVMQKAPEGLPINTFARLTQHDTFGIHVDGKCYLSLNHKMEPWEARRCDLWEKMRFRLIDAHDERRPIVAIESRHFGNYLRVSRGDRKVLGQSFIDLEERFRLAFLDDPENSASKQKASIKHLATNTFMALGKNGKLAFGDKESFVWLERADADVPINAVTRLENHKVYGLHLPGCYLSVNERHEAWEAPRCAQWETFDFKIVDGSNDIEPIVTIRSRHFGTFLRIRDNEVKFQKAVAAEERFRIGLQGVAGKSERQYNAWIQSVSFGTYLAIKNGKLVASKTRQLLKLDKVLMPKDINVVAWLSQHDTYALHLSDCYVQLDWLRNGNTVKSCHSWEKFRIEVVDASNPNQPIVGIKNLAHDAYLRGNEGYRIRGQNYIGHDEKFEIGFVDADENDGFKQQAWIRSVASGRYIGLEDGKPRLLRHQRILTIERVDFRWWD